MPGAGSTTVTLYDVLPPPPEGTPDPSQFSLLTPNPLSYTATAVSVKDDGKTIYEEVLILTQAGIANSFTTISAPAPSSQTITRESFLNHCAHPAFLTHKFHGACRLLC